VDGGTQGLYLVDLLREHNPVVIFDAVDFGDPPATMRLVENDDIPAFVGAHKMSLHQAGLQDVIACAKLLGGCATDMLLIGIQPVELEDYGGSLRPQVQACISRALAVAVDYLAGFGIVLTPRTEGAAPEIIARGLDLANYETGRPDAAAAWRHGDERVLSRLTGD
jgi:hydrogenase maturation protease